MSVDRKIIAPCPNPGFIPYPLGQRFSLDECIPWVLHGEDLPLFSSPLGEPFGPSEISSPNMPSADFSFAITPISQRSVPPTAGSHATSQGTEETSRAKTQNFPRVKTGFIKSRSERDSSSRAFGLGFLQTPPRDDAPFDKLKIYDLPFSSPSAPRKPGMGTLTP